MSDHQLLFVIGAPKTCTSSVMAMLNCHSEIFLMYEAFMDMRIKLGAEKICAHYKVHPTAFAGPKSKGVDPSFNKLRKLVDKSKQYRYFGDKWARLDSFKKTRQRVDMLGSNKVIFTARDLRTWLSHKTVISTQSLAEPDRVSLAAIKYTYFLVQSKRLPNGMMVRLEDFVEHNDAIIDKIDAWLPNVSLRPAVEEWWTKTGNYPDVNKMIYKWWAPGEGRIRASSFAKPEKKDISVKIKQNWLWDQVLPIFDKYYENPDKQFSEQEINNDLNYLIKLDRKPISLEDCFEDIQTVKIGV